MSLYSRYITERTGKEIIENEKGFVVYSFNEDSVYIEDIFIEADFRKQGYAAVLADMVSDRAKAKGIRKMFGSVVPTTKNSTTSVQVLIAYGMKLYSSTNNFILFQKEI